MDLMQVLLLMLAATVALARGQLNNGYINPLFLPWNLEAANIGRPLSNIPSRPLKINYLQNSFNEGRPRIYYKSYGLGSDYDVDHSYPENKWYKNYYSSGGSFDLLSGQSLNEQLLAMQKASNRLRLPNMAQLQTGGELLNGWPGGELLDGRPGGGLLGEMRGEKVQDGRWVLDRRALLGRRRILDRGELDERKYLELNKGPDLGQILNGEERIKTYTPEVSVTVQPNGSS